jgi:hypothetical protein
MISLVCLYTSGTKSTFPSFCLVQTLYLFNVRAANAFENELSNTVSPSDLKCLVRMVEQNNAHIAAVIGINHTGANINVVLQGQARTRSCRENVLNKSSIFSNSKAIENEIISKKWDLKKKHIPQTKPNQTKPRQNEQEARKAPRTNSAIAIFWYGNCKISLNKRLSTGRNGILVSTVYKFKPG